MKIENKIFTRSLDNKISTYKEFLHHYDEFNKKINQNCKNKYSPFNPLCTGFFDSMGWDSVEEFNDESGCFSLWANIANTWKKKNYAIFTSSLYFIIDFYINTTSRYE